jgi:hypothetical protein
VFGTHVDYSAGPVDNLWFAGGGGRLDAGSAELGPVVIGTTDTLAVELANTGHLPLAIGTLPTPGAPFSYASDGCSGATLQPSATCTVEVRFAPAFESDFSATLSIPSDAPSAPTAWTLHGTGVLGGSR